MIRTTAAVCTTLASCLLLIICGCSASSSTHVERRHTEIRTAAPAASAPQRKEATPPVVAVADDAGGRKVAQVDFRAIVKRATDRVFPAVVFIRVLQETHESGKKMTQEISGSGVIISPTGEVLTNWHVIDKAVRVRCLLSDGRAVTARVIGSDKDTDLAMIQLELAADFGPLPHAELGDSTVLCEGDFVMAMGAPWGLSRSVSIGIISCTRRYLKDNSQYSLWLQTDAAISPGNSGGPLVNTAGQVIGINTLATMSGGDMGFAVPTETIRHIIPQLREHGRMNWSWAGLQLQPLKDFNRDVYFSADEGVIVAETDPESPARRAGILANDRILHIGDINCTVLHDEDLPRLNRGIGLLTKHETVQVTLVREGKEHKLELVPREKGKVEGEELDCPRWDLTVKTINQFDNRDLHFYRQQGVFIFGIKRPGNASVAGLRDQDILLEIEGREVVTLDDVRAIHKEAIENVDKKFRYKFVVMRNGLTRQIVMDFSRDYKRE